MMLKQISCILFLVAASSQLVEVFGAQPSIELADKSYRISATLFIAHGSNRNYVYEVQEYHSAWQKRSHVSYRTISESQEAGVKSDFPRTATFYSDGGQILMRNEDTRVCEEVSKQFSDRLFNLNQLSLLKPSSIIGPSRLVHFASSNTKNARSPNAAGPQLTDLPGMERYDYEISGQNAVYSLYYYKDANRNLPHGMPAILNLITADSEALLSYEFKQIDFLQNQPLFGESGSLSQQYSALGDPVVLDWLAIPPFSRCDSVLRRISGTTTNPFSREFRFSFAAQSGDLSSFVGYEPAIKTLRVDRVSGSRSTETISNFNSALTYHVMRRRHEHDDIMDNLIQVKRNEKLDDDLLCIVTKAATTDATMQGGFRLGAMLFGSSDLAYLGVAQVRGIEARAYLAYDSQWPVWIQQPIKYHTTEDWINPSKKTETRAPVDQNKNLVLMTVIYLTYTEKLEDQLSGKLLMMQFHKLNKETLDLVETRSYQIYDFSRHFTGEGPTGVSIEQFYSLGDSCSSPSAEDNHYGRLELLLNHESPMNESETSTSEWLAEPRKRNFAIMRVAQEVCALPATNVYDIESRYQMRTTGDQEAGLQKSSSIAASLRLLEHTRSLVQLIYIGRGSLKEGQLKKFQRFYTASFQSCYFICAHKKVGSLFAFEPEKALCYMYKSPVLGNAKLTIQETFEIGATRPLEVYRIRHATDVKMEDELSVLAHSDLLFRRMSKLMLWDPEDEKNKVSVEVKSVEASELNEETPMELDELGFSGSNKFMGFGLVADDRSSRPIEPRRLDTNDWLDEESRRKFAHMPTEMTFGQCQAACMADFECEAFSVCVKNAQIECILSKVSFRSEVVLLQMLQTLDDQSKRLGAEFELLLDDGLSKVKVKQHPGCELHNKLYSDFFTKSSGHVRVNLAERFLVSVGHRDDCAKMCLNETLSVMRSEVEEARKASWTALNEPGPEPGTIPPLFDQFKAMHQKSCSSAFYLDRSNFLSLGSAMQDWMQRQIVGRSENDLTRGYCILGASPTDLEREAWKAPDGKPLSEPHSNLQIPVTRYNFDFLNLFEKQQGVSLVASKMGPQESEAYKQLTNPASRRNLTREQLQAIRAFIQRDENIVHEVMYNEAGECARLCFLQESQMWPACRSFDLIELQVYTARETHCFLNTISIRDALRSERFDLVRDKTSQQEHIRPYHQAKIIRVTHYEPRDGFVASSMSFAALLTLDETYIDQISPFMKHELHVGSFGLFVTIPLALVFGIASGVMIGARVLIPHLRKQPDDSEVLVEPPTIEFNNLVNFEGQFRETDANPSRQAQ